MDMQNVSNLQIPEGEVKTIHDGNGRLLWGGVGYNTKYAGNTTQTTYTGKNLVSPSSVIVKYNPYSGMVFSKSVFIPAGTYSVSISNVTNATSWRLGFKFFYTDGTNVLNAITQGVVTFPIGISIGDSYSGNTVCALTRDGTVTSLYFTTTVDTYVVFAIMFGDVSNSTTLDYQLEVGQTSSTYEPYTGGIPSPSPNYPQPINVVTGAQTATVSDGINSEAFPISLGSIELCKIGDSQDYIYKSGDDWYIHKSVKKSVFTGTEVGWNRYAGTATRHGGFYLAVPDGLSGASCVSNQFVADGSAPWEGATYSCRITDTSNAIFLTTAINVAPDSVTDWRAWLGDHNLSFYYALATPTDAQITDATLIGQLNDVHGWLTRYGYNATVSGNLPIVLQRNSLQ